MKPLIERPNHALGVLEHGMYLKRMCEHEIPLRSSKEERANKCNSEGATISKEESDGP